MRCFRRRRRLLNANGRIWDSSEIQTFHQSGDRQERDAGTDQVGADGIPRQSGIRRRFASHRFRGHCAGLRRGRFYLGGSGGLRAGCRTIPECARPCHFAGGSRSFGAASSGQSNCGPSLEICRVPGRRRAEPQQDRTDRDLRQSPGTGVARTAVETQLATCCRCQDVASQKEVVSESLCPRWSLQSYRQPSIAVFTSKLSCTRRPRSRLYRKRPRDQSASPRNSSLYFAKSLNSWRRSKLPFVSREHSPFASTPASAAIRRISTYFSLPRTLLWLCGIFERRVSSAKFGIQSSCTKRIDTGFPSI